MYVGLKQPRGDGERYVTPARAAAKETTVLYKVDCISITISFPEPMCLLVSTRHGALE